MLAMDKHSRIKLMRRKRKLFPWLRTFYSKYSEKFFSAENNDIFEYLFFNVEKEMKDIYLELNEEKSKDFFNILNSLFLHFCWQIRWNSCKNWQTFWKKGKTTRTSKNDSHRKCCVLLLHYMILLSIFLTGGDEKSDWIGRILTAMNSLPDAADILCSALLLTSDLKKKHKPVYSIILKHTLCCDTVKNTLEPQIYCKVILLFRRLLKLTKDKTEKAHILNFTAKLNVPSDIQNWLSSQNIEDSKDLNYDDNLTQELLSRSYPDELLRKLSEILTEDSFCKRKSLTLDSIDAYNIPSNVTSKENVSEDSNGVPGENLESFDKTHLQNGLDGIRTTTSCKEAENLSNDVNNRIKDKDLNKESRNPIEEMPYETNVNHYSESLQKATKNPKLENGDSKKNSHKKKKDKISKESSKKHTKNEKISKETPETTALKISDVFETCSKLSVPALDIDECPSNVTSKENVSGDLNSELNEDLLETFNKTNLQNGLDGIRTTTSCLAAENLSNDVNNRMRVKDLNKEEQNPIEEMSSETKIYHCSEPLQKALITQKLENAKNKRDRHKKKKDKISKESSKKHKKDKKKSKETPVTTGLKISDEFGTSSKLNVPELDIDECPSVTSIENVLEDINRELDKDLLESLDKTSIQNGMNGVKIKSSTAAENTSIDINNIIKNKDKTKEVLNPIEGMSGETNVNHCPKSLKNTCKKQKVENEGSKKSKTKKKKKDKILKESSKKHKKNKKKSKEKPDKTAVKTNEGFEPNFKLSVDINVPSNVTKDNISEDLNCELDKDLLESLDKTSIQNGMNGVETTSSSTAAESTSNDINSLIENKTKGVLNPIEGMFGETNVNHSPKSLKKISKKQKLENESSKKSKTKKKKKDKILKESSKKHKKNKKKSKETTVTTALKISDEFETCSKLNVCALDIDEFPSNVTSIENVLEDLNSDLDKDVLESLDKTSIQNGMNGVETTTSSTAAENTSNDINNIIKNKTKGVLYPLEGMSGKTNVSHSPKSLKKTCKKQKLENKDSERSKTKKKKKDKILKESSKRHKKNKKKSKEKPDKTGVKTNEEFEPNFKLSVDINVPSNFAKDNISEDLNGELDGDILESVVKTNMQNDLNDIKSMKKDKDLHNILSNPMEEICNEVNVACCSESLKKASKKRKLENEESEKRNHKKKKKDKVLKQSSKDRKKKKSKEKPGNAALNIGKALETYSEINVPASNIDIPSSFSSKENVSEDLYEALVESNTPDMQNDSTGVEATSSCMAAENISIDINNRIKNKGLHNVSNPMGGTCGESLEKQKLENEDCERRNCKKKKKDKVLKQSSKDCKKNKKKSYKNKEFETPYNKSNSQKHKKSKKKADKTAVKINKELETCPQLSLATSHIKESHRSRKSLDNDIENSYKQDNCSLNSGRKRSKSTSNIGESHDFENPLVLKEFPHEQQDCNMKTKRKRSKSENEEKKRSHSKKSKKQSREKKVTKHKEVTDFDLPDTILPVENFSEPENLIPQIENQDQGEKQKKLCKEKLQMSTERLKTAGFDNPDTISKGNCYGSSLIKESTIDEPKEFPKVKRKKLFNNDLYCLKKSLKEIQPSTTIANNCIVPTNLSPSKRHSFLDNNDTNDCIDMPSANSNVDSNFSSSEETTAFSDVSMSDILNFSKIDIYRHNAALGIADNRTSKSKREKKQNSNVDEQNEELSLLKNDLLMASKKILQQSYISETFKSQSFIDNESGAEETEKDDNQSTETLSFCEANIKKSVVGSDSVDGNKVSNKCTSTAVLLSKQSNEVKSTAVYQHSQFTNNAEGTFLSMNYSSGQDFEAGIKIHTTSSESRFCSFSHSSLNPSVVLNNVLQNKSAQRSVSSSEKSFALISEPDSETQSTTPHRTDTNLEMGVSHELNSENIAKANELYGYPSVVLNDVLQNKSAQRSVSSSEKSFASISESYQSSTPPRTDTNLEMGVSHELTSENIAKANELYGKKEGALIDLFHANRKSNPPSVQNVSMIPIDNNLNHNNELSEFQSPSLQAANSSNNIFLNEPELLANSVSKSQFNASVTKSHANNCGTQYLNTENVNYKSVGTSTEIINSNNFADNCNNYGNSNEISNKVSSVQVTINFTGSEDCSESRKQFMAQFDFQTGNDSKRIPLISSVSFTPANASTPMINHNPNLDSMKNHDPLHITHFNQTSNSIDKNVDPNRCRDANISHKPEEIGQCGGLNDSGLSQTVCSKSSPAIINNSNNITECHPQLFSNTVALNSGKNAFFHSSFSKNENLLSQDRDFKLPSTENLESLNRESNELSFKAKVMNNDSSFRTCSIYSDESADSSSLSSASDYPETEVSVEETLEVGAAALNNEKESFDKNAGPLLQEGNFKPLTTENLDSLNREAKVMNNDTSHRSSTIYLGESDDNSSLTTSISNYSEIQREVSAAKTPRTRNVKFYKSHRIIEVDSDDSESPLMPVKIEETKSEECSKEDSNISKSTSYKGKTPGKNLPPVYNHKTKSKEYSKEDSSLNNSTSNNRKTPKKSLPKMKSNETRSKKCSKEDSSLSKSTSNEGKTPGKNIPPVINRYNLRARKALQTRQLFSI